MQKMGILLSLWHPNGIYKRLNLTKKRHNMAQHKKNVKTEIREIAIKSEKRRGGRE